MFLVVEKLLYSDRKIKFLYTAADIMADKKLSFIHLYPAPNDKVSFSYIKNAFGHFI